ncbi:MAG: ATP-dependent DNA helicase [Candidatus Bathyarchaeota archaeon]|nr:ATP-dependent DNA helicase [Candidatus Bathyarchaeum tardum]WNZ29790.1 MAG: ATP-dependent DNA helicase [Candidatus Bathyarchaeota archaeon]
MPRIYVCRKCHNKYTSEEFDQNRFCLDCGTFLSPRVVSSQDVPKRTCITPAVAVQTKDSGDPWLPIGYEVRKGQVEFVKEATKALENNEVFIGSAPCGIGKSLASLLSILPMLGDNKLLISFRTRSQLHIFLKELRGLKKAPLTVSFFSKQDMCPLTQKRAGTYFDFLEECKRLKENCETSTKPFCKYYWKTLMRRREAERLAMDCARKIVDPQTASFKLAKEGFCAYEALKMILSKVQIFLGTYHYTFNSPVRKSLLQSWGVDLSDVYLIVDEAHNIPDFSRDLLSDRITQFTIENALKETENFEHDASGDVQDFLNVLDDDVFRYIQKDLGTSNLKLLDHQDLAKKFQEWSGTSSEKAAEIFHEYGEYVKQVRQEQGYDRVFSYTHRVGDFVENFFQKTGEKYVHMIQKEWGDRIYLGVKSLDGREVTDPVLREAKGSIVMSGFLSPPKVYRDLILYSKKGVHLKEFDSPFPAENRLILAASDVSSRYEQRTDSMLKKCADYIETISLANQGNMAVFFTSYYLMNSILSQTDLGRTVIVEERKTRQKEVMDKLNSSRNNVLFGVMGGKFSEGMDYPNNLLTCVVTVGLPYATWSVYQKALIDYFDYQFPGNGRAYAYLTPAIFRLVQACGRAHRSAEDKGCIIMLDERVNHYNIKQLLPSYYQKEMKTVANPMECAENVTRFWNKHNNYC